MVIFRRLHNLKAPLVEHNYLYAAYLILQLFAMLFLVGHWSACWWIELIHVDGRHESADMADGTALYVCDRNNHRIHCGEQHVIQSMQHGTIAAATGAAIAADGAREKVAAANAFKMRGVDVQRDKVCDGSAIRALAHTVLVKSARRKHLAGAR